MQLVAQAICGLLAICVLSNYATTVPTSLNATFNRGMKVKAVKRLILSKLMMTQPPTVTAKQLQSVTQDALNAYSMAAKMNARKMSKLKTNEEQYYATTTTSSLVTELSGTICGGKTQSKFYRCNNDKLPTAYRGIKRAVLQLYYKPVATSGQDIVLFTYQLTESCSKKGGYNRVLLDTRHLSSTRTGYIEIDITRAVKAWATRKSVNYGIEVEVVGDHERCSNNSPYNSGLATPYSTYIQSSYNSSVPRNQRPTLFVTSDLSHSVYPTSRGRRQILDYDYCDSLDPSNPNCCIQYFELDLKKDLNWDWIVQPTVINLNQCVGECPPTWAEDTNYTQIINEYRTLNPAGSVAPCCTPKTLEDIEIFYFDGLRQAPVMGTLSDVIVTSCVCA